MTQLRNGVEIILTLRFFDCDASGVELLAHTTNLVNGMLLIVPLRTEHGLFFPNIGELFGKCLETGLGCVVLLVFQRSFLNLKL